MRSYKKKCGTRDKFGRDKALHNRALCAVPYNSIKQIESHVIEGHEEYSIIALHLHSQGKVSQALMLHSTLLNTLK